MNVMQPPSGVEDSIATMAAAIDRETTALAAAQSTGRWIRNLLFLALLSFLGASLYSFWTVYKEVQGDAYRNRLHNEARAYLEKNNDRYMREAQHFLEKNGPVLTDAVWKQAKADMPALMKAVEKERDSFQREITEKITQKFQTHFEKEMQNRQEVLQKEFKQVEDQALRQKLVQNLALAAQGLGRRYYVQTINGEMNSLYQGWDAFPTAEAPRKGEEKLEDQLIQTLWTLLTQKLALTSALPTK